MTVAPQKKARNVNQRLVSRGLALLAAIFCFAAGYVMGTRERRHDTESSAPMRSERTEIRLEEHAVPSSQYAPGERFTKQEVLAFFERCPFPTRSHTQRALQRTREFDYVRWNLDSILEWPELQGESPLSLAVWRAALLYGTDEQLVLAANRCFHDAVPGAVVSDFVGRPILASTVLLNREISDEFQEGFCLQLSNMGLLGLARVLQVLMESDDAEEVRIMAAYNLAFWGEDTVAGQQAESYLAELAKTSYDAASWYAILQGNRKDEWRMRIKRNQDRAFIETQPSP